MSKSIRWSWLLTLFLASGGAYALAQAKPATPSAPRPAAVSCEHGCPMHEAFELANVQVENTAQGAVIKLVAKKPEDVARVQELASKLSTEAGCPMMQGDAHAAHHGMMMHHHGPGTAAPAPAPAAPAAPAPAPKK